jgi:hypothetical protein
MPRWSAPLDAVRRSPRNDDFGRLLESFLIVAVATIAVRGRCFELVDRRWFGRLLARPFAVWALLSLFGVARAATATVAPPAVVRT